MLFQLALLQRGNLPFYAAMVLLAGCRTKPVECEVQSFHRPAQTTQAGERLDVTRLGARLPRAPMQAKPRFMTLTDGNRVELEWRGFGHFHGRSELSFFPGEKLARGKEPDEVYPMIRLRENGTDLVRFAFKTRLCADLDAIEEGGYCREYQRNEEMLIAEAVCGR